MKTLISFFVSMLFFVCEMKSQVMWEETADTPSGIGVVDMVYVENINSLFVTTASFNWPDGEAGGIRRSTDEGQTWENLVDCYSAGRIISGSTGTLYSSYWPYPEPEGLYRSTDNGITWDMLTQVPSGNTFSALAVDDIDVTNEAIIYAGLGTGIYRSKDDGENWEYANNGFESNTSVWEIAVNKDGAVAAGTNNGVYISFDQGDLWEKVTGTLEMESITSLSFEYPETENQPSQLIIGTDQGNIYTAHEDVEYLACTLAYLFLDGNTQVEVVGSLVFNDNDHFVYSATGTFMPPFTNSGFSVSETGWESLEFSNDGLPFNPMIKAVGTKILFKKNSSEAQVFLGLFGTSSGGAKVYKANYGLVGVQDKLETVEFVTIYPNPATDQINFKLNTHPAANVEFTIYDTFGKVLYSAANLQAIDGEINLNWNCSKLDSGIYLYSARYGDFVTNGKWVKK